MTEFVWRYLSMKHRWRLFSIACLVVSLVTIAFLCDNAVDRLMQFPPNSPWRPFAVFISKYADWPFLILYAVLIFAGAFVFANSRLMIVALAMGISCGVCGTTATIIRSLTGRTRPSAHEAQGWYGAFHNSHCLIGNHDFNSFPSGHVGAIVGFAVPLLLGTRRGRFPAVALSLAVAWSRLFLRCHHFSDVMVAATIGVIGGIFIWHWISQKHLDFRRRSSVRPLIIAPKPLEQS
jgi:membrane-associated phospholipid phosphatase